MLREGHGMIKLLIKENKSQNVKDKLAQGARSCKATTVEERLLKRSLVRYYLVQAEVKVAGK